MIYLQLHFYESHMRTSEGYKYFYSNIGTFLLTFLAI